jgi:membrane-associated phospholipid phosphatase
MNEQNPISAPAAKPAAPRFAKLIGLFVLILLPLYFFGSLAEDVINKEGLFFDKPILLFLHQHATANWDAAMIFFTTTGSARVIVPFNVLVLLLLVFKKQWAKSWFWIFTVGGAALMNLLAKHAFSRTRPDLWMSILPETTFSFPSGHAMQSMAVACGVVALLWETRWRNLAVFIAIPFVVAVGTSRAYLGVHYPSDILAGWLASFAWVIGLSAAFAHLQRKHGVAPSPTHQAPHPALFDDTSAPTVVERRR